MHIKGKASAPAEIGLKHLCTKGESDTPPPIPVRTMVPVRNRNNVNGVSRRLIRPYAGIDLNSSNNFAGIVVKA